MSTGYSEKSYPILSSALSISVNKHLKSTNEKIRPSPYNEINAIILIITIITITSIIIMIIIIVIKIPRML